MHFIAFIPPTTAPYAIDSHYRKGLSSLIDYLHFQSIKEKQKTITGRSNELKTEFLKGLLFHIRLHIFLYLRMRNDWPTGETDTRHSNNAISRHFNSHTRNEPKPVYVPTTNLLISAIRIWCEQDITHRKI